MARALSDLDVQQAIGLAIGCMEKMSLLVPEEHHSEMQDIINRLICLVEYEKET